MSIYKYEEAIVKKLRDITGDDRIIITPSDNIFNIIPRIAQDELKLPLIHIIRNNWKLTHDRHHGMKMNGLINDEMPMFRTHSGISPEDGKIHRLHTIPISFAHTFEVWTRTREENDNIIRELIWFFSTLGQLEVEIPYGVNIKHQFSLQLLDDVIDNSDVVSHKDAGELFLQAIQTTCDDAFLWKSSTHNPICVDVDFELKTNQANIVNRPDLNKKMYEENFNKS